MVFSVGDVREFLVHLLFTIINVDLIQFQSLTHFDIFISQELLVVLTEPEAESVLTERPNTAL